MDTLAIKATVPGREGAPVLACTAAGAAVGAIVRWVAATVWPSALQGFRVDVGRRRGRGYFLSGTGATRLARNLGRAHSTKMSLRPGPVGPYKGSFRWMPSHTIRTQSAVGRTDLRYWRSRWTEPAQRSGARSLAPARTAGP
jgi:hypothetical protein